jgi:hypothetical protein
MARGKGQEVLPPLPWASDENAAVWKLVSLLEEPENRRKLFGKEPSEVSITYFISKYFWLNSGLTWP